MEFKQKINLAKLGVVHLIPVIGVIFFDWELFELAVIYLLETLAIFIVYNFDCYFFEPETRYPFPFALVQLSLALIPLTGILAGNAILVYVFVTPIPEDSSGWSLLLEAKYESMSLFTPFMILLLIEFIAYYIKKVHEKNHVKNSHWRMWRRILYANLYIACGTFVLSLFPQNLLVMIPFFIGLKIMLDFSTNDKRFLNNIRHQLMKKR